MKIRKFEEYLIESTNNNLEKYDWDKLREYFKTKIFYFYDTLYHGTKSANLINIVKNGPELYNHMELEIQSFSTTINKRLLYNVFGNNEGSGFEFPNYEGIKCIDLSDFFSLFFSTDKSNEWLCNPNDSMYKLCIEMGIDDIEDKSDRCLKLIVDNSTFMNKLLSFDEFKEISGFKLYEFTSRINGLEENEIALTEYGLTQLFNDDIKIYFEGDEFTLDEFKEFMVDNEEYVDEILDDYDMYDEGGMNYIDDYDTFILESIINDIFKDNLKNGYIKIDESLVDKFRDFLNDKLTHDNLDKVGRIIDRISNLKFFNAIPIATMGLIVMTYLGYTPNDIKNLFNLDEKGKQELVDKIKTEKEEEIKKVDDFLKAISDRESGNDPNSINKFGYIGKYQFGKAALKDIGVDVDSKNFKKKRSKVWSSDEQDEAMKKLIKKNLYYLRNFMDYDGDTIAGIKITKSGLVAASHLSGASNVKKFLLSGGKKIHKDGFGTPLTEYLDKFKDYDLSELE